MADLLRNLARSLSTSSSSTSSSSLDTSANKQIVSIKDIETHLQNWSIPKTPVSHVYNKGSFLYKSDYIIKTVEQTLPITQGHMNVELLPKRLLEEAVEREFKFLHIGLVQVAVKPLTREGLNTSSLLCLRDKRHLRFNDSLLGCVTATLSEGPVYFNSFPNFSVSLLDPTILKTLTLNIQTAGFEMDPLAINLALVYRIYIKVMNTLTPDINLKNKFIKDKRGETTVFQVNPKKAQISVPSTLKWENISIPEDWKLINEVPKRIPGGDRTLQQVVENSDGSVNIRFGNNRSIRIDPCDEPRRSTSSISQRNKDASSTVSSRRSTSSLEGVIHLAADPISRPTYRVVQPAEIPRAQSPTTGSRPTSPTVSDFEYTGLYTLTNQIFTPDHTLLNQWFNSNENQKRREWFFQTYSSAKQSWIREVFFDFLKESKKNVDFFVFLKYWSKVKGLPFPTEKDLSTDNLNVIDNPYKPYRAVSTEHTVVSAIHPPAISVFVGGTTKATPYKKECPKILENNKMDMLCANQLIEQNNYTNLFLQSLGAQTTRIEKMVENKAPSSTALKATPAEASTPKEGSSKSHNFDDITLQSVPFRRPP